MQLRPSRNVIEAHRWVKRKEAKHTISVADAGALFDQFRDCSPAAFDLIVPTQLLSKLAKSIILPTNSPNHHLHAPHSALGSCHVHAGHGLTKSSSWLLPLLADRPASILAGPCHLGGCQQVDVVLQNPQHHMLVVLQPWPVLHSGRPPLQLVPARQACSSLSQLHIPRHLALQAP